MNTVITNLLAENYRLRERIAELEESNKRFAVLVDRAEALRDEHKLRAILSGAFRAGGE